MVQKPGSCRRCGATGPCGCEGREGRGLILLPGLLGPGEDPFEGVPLVREVKGPIVGRPFLSEEGEVLLLKARELERHLALGAYSEADALATDCLARILCFPRRPSLLRSFWAFFLLGALLLGLGLLYGMTLP